MTRATVAPSLWQGGLRALVVSTALISLPALSGAIAQETATPATQTQEEAAPPSGTEMVTTFTLDNGMMVVVVEDHRAPVAA